ncbi:tryptophan-rich sensory protein [Ectothiorhodospiraceae bacterium WFHF3C12]|nr:tryptophan-rich sensory protein [Ectothiorhodospiraceae bacterium WFHF3C12]
MSLLTLLAFLGACAAAAATGALFSPGSWYRGLDKPAWTPPDWLFPVAWTLLYLAIAVAAWRVAYSGAAVVPLALAVWACQIALNAIWTPVFFGLRRLRGALVILAFLWLAVLATLVCFLAADVLAGLLIVPYLAWLSYAAALNLSVWRRNPDERAIQPSEQVLD